MAREREALRESERERERARERDRVWEREGRRNIRTIRGSEKREGIPHMWGDKERIYIIKGVYVRGLPRGRGKGAQIVFSVYTCDCERSYTVICIYFIYTKYMCKKLWHY